MFLAMTEEPDTNKSLIMWVNTDYWAVASRLAIGPTSGPQITEQ